MVGRAGSPTPILHVNVTLTRSKVKVKVTGLLEVPKIAENCTFLCLSHPRFRHGTQK